MKYKLNSFNRENALGIVVGSTKRFWPYFIKYIHSLESLPANPVDSFYDHVVKKVLSMEPFCNYEHEVRYDWYVPKSGKFVHVQTAGHLAGTPSYR